MSNELIFPGSGKIFSHDVFNWIIITWLSAAATSDRFGFTQGTQNRCKSLQL
ncbi:hypothetical protein KBT16_28840 [Nostoc sp. CCCryo 231-06]|nr:hypothetical protein [Nostoc sp. CCCryo 231-06]